MARVNTFKINNSDPNLPNNGCTMVALRLSCGANQNANWSTQRAAGSLQCLSESTGKTRPCSEVLCW